MRDPRKGTADGLKHVLRLHGFSPLAVFEDEPNGTVYVLVEGDVNPENSSVWAEIRGYCPAGVRLVTLVPDQALLFHVRFREAANLSARALRLANKQVADMVNWLAYFVVAIIVLVVALAVRW